MRSLDEVIAAYLKARDAGNAPEREAWLEANVAHAEALAAFLDDLDRAGGWVDAFALPEDATSAPHIDPLPTRAPATADVVRYFGDYEISEEIARGGMGVVYRARQVSLNRPVALKMIAPGLLENEQAVRRFRLEAEAAAGLDHPGIVPIYEIGEHEGQHYFSMQLIEGQGLDTLAGRYVGRPAQSAELLRDVADAIAHGHHRGVLHRDLKPGNILVDRDGRPHVTDFGLAKRLDVDAGLTQTGDMMGTPTHMAPEQAAAGEVTTSTDVWGLGVVLYELLTGHVPFRGATLLETIRMIREEVPVAPQRERGEVPSDLETICLKCLEKDPSRRYGDMGELAEDLRRQLRGEPIRARPVGSLERAWMWSRRKPAAAALLSLGFLVLVGVIVGALWFGRHQADVADTERELRYEADAERGRADAQRDLADAREREARDLAYASSMALAARAWHDGDVLSLDGLLGKHVPQPGAEDRRDFVWHYLRAHRTDARVLEADGGYVVNAGGVLLAPSRADSAWVGFRDPATGSAFSEARGYSGLGISGIRAASSADGGTCLTAGLENRQGRSLFLVRIWDMAERSLLASYDVDVSRGNRREAALALSPDGGRLCVYDGRRRLTIRDTRSGRILQTMSDLVQARGIRFRSDRLEYVRTVKRDGVHRLGLVRHPFEGEREVVVSDFEFPVAWNELSAVAWSPDGALAALGTHDGTVAVIEASSGQTRFARRLHDGFVHVLAFSTDGTLLASGANDGLTKVTHARTGRSMTPLRGTGAPVHDLVFLGGGRLAGATLDQLLLWDRKEPAADWVVEPHIARGSIGFDPDQEPNLAVVSGGGGFMWSCERQGAVRKLVAESGGYHGAATPDGRRFAVLSFKGRLDLWNAGEAAAYRSIDLALEEEKAVELAISPAGDMVAVGQIDFGVRFIDADTGKERAVWKNSRGGQGDMVFSPDGSTLAICGNGDVPLALIDVVTGKRTREFGIRETWNTSPIFSPDGRLFATVCRPSVHVFARVTVWRTDTWEVLSRSTRELQDISRIAFHPGGRTIAAGRHSGEIILVDVVTGIETLALSAHKAPIGTLCFSPDGRTLWTAAGKEIRAWRTKPK